MMVGFAIATQKWIVLGTIAGLSLVLVWPVEVALGGFALLIPFDSIAVLGDQSSGQGATTLNWYVGAGAAVILLCVGLAGGRIHRPPTAAVFWGLFIAWGALSVMWALDPDLAMQRLTTAAGLFGLYLVVVSLRATEKELRTVMLLTIMGGVVAALYVTKSFFGGTSYRLTMRASLIAVQHADDPNQFATCLLLPLALATGMFFSFRRQLAKLVMLGPMAAIAMGIFVTMSRGALVAMALMWGIFVVRSGMRWRALAPIPIFLLLLLLMPAMFFTRWDDSRTWSGAGRVGIWMAAAHMLQHYGVAGAGLDNFTVAYNQYAGATSAFEGYGRNAHNIYLTTWGELGIVGLGLLLMAGRTQLRAAARAAKRSMVSRMVASVPCEAACWAMLASGFFLDILWRKVFWFSWGLLAVVLRMQQSNASERDSSV
jgi:O-antigen ligase